MEPDFPFEFVVPGTPVSLQRDDRRAKQAWKSLVRAASSDRLPEGHFATGARLSITLYYYPEDRMIGDLDNVVKLTLDAMSKHIYLDDRQIERLVVQKFEKDFIFPFSDPSKTLAACMLGAKPALYIRISTDPHEELRR